MMQILIQIMSQISVPLVTAQERASMKALPAQNVKVAEYVNTIDCRVV